jgi:deoxyguanosine kinase
MKYIIVEGNIGAGKTSLAKRLAEDLEGHLILEEFADNTFLPQFYQEPKKYAFPLELSFLAARYQQLIDLTENQIHNLVIADYHFEKSRLFASVNLSDSEFRLYDNFFQILKKSLVTPDLVIFLRKDIGKLRENITKRGREYERDIPELYLENVHGAYVNFLQSVPQNRLMEINSNNLDFVGKDSDYQFIINMVRSKL